MREDPITHGPITLETLTEVLSIDRGSGRLVSFRPKAAPDQEMMASAPGHGMMSPGPEPYHLEIANAANGVLGEIPGGVLTGKGTLLDKDTYNWAPWEPTVGDPDRGLGTIRSVAAMRRGPGYDYLVLGRMQKPGAVEGIPVVEWVRDGKAHAIPAVFHAAWEALDGRFAVALANWTDRPRRVRLREPRLGGRAAVHVAGETVKRPERLERRERGSRRETVTVTVPPLAMVLVERL